jgi:REP element-mobilizing transposase RayT
VEFAGATYHIMARGNRGSEIFFNQQDSLKFLEILGDVAEAHDWTCHAYCLMPNHYHLLVQTRSPSLSKGMQQLNGRYASYANKVHELGGHLLQGRFKAVLVEQDSYFTELVRYIALNPVRAGLAPRPEHWRWGSFKALVSGEPDSAAAWYDPTASLNWYGETPDAAASWQGFVEKGLSADQSKVDLLERQLETKKALGSEAFAATLAEKGLSKNSVANPDQKPISFYAEGTKFRGAGMAAAYLKGGHRQTDIAEFFNVDVSTVSKAVARHR